LVEIAENVFDELSVRGLSPALSVRDLSVRDLSVRGLSPDSPDSSTEIGLSLDEMCLIKLQKMSVKLTNFSEN
jgi:hypothetical protein